MSSFNQKKTLRENPPGNKKKSNKSLRPNSQAVLHFLSQNFQGEIKIGLSSPKNILNKTEYYESTAKTSEIQNSNVHVPHINNLLIKEKLRTPK